MRKDFSFQSRHERSQKRKQNLFLNILIGVVFIAILAVGVSILFGGDDEQAANSDENTTSLPENGNQSADTNSNEDNTSSESNTSDEGTKDEQDSEKSEDPSKDEKDADGENSGEEPEGTYQSPENGGPDGTWEPVGTVQEGEHVSSYDEGSVDWKEKKKALQYATGLSADEIVYWWIGNGGSAQTAKGVVSTAENRANPYVVMLKWVDGEGWKPTSVERVPGAADQN